MTLRASALSTLTSWHPPTAEQRLLRDSFAAALTDDVDAWSRHGRPDHLTASALVVDPGHTQVLLGLHAKVGLWLQFGGHLEPDDQSLAAAGLREAVEESGIADLQLASPQPLRLDQHRAPCAPDARDHLDVQFLAIAPPGAAPRVSEESLDVRWFAADDLPADTDDAVRRLVADARAR